MILGITLFIKLSTNLGIFSGHINNLMIEAVQEKKPYLMFEIRNKRLEILNNLNQLH